MYTKPVLYIPCSASEVPKVVTGALASKGDWQEVLQETLRGTRPCKSIPHLLHVWYSSKFSN